MHIFDYSFLKNDLLPAQLVSLASNISMLKVMTNVRKEKNEMSFKQLEEAAKIESVKASNAMNATMAPVDHPLRANKTVD